MITAELVDYILENVSSTEFDVIVYSVLHSDWDGRIHATPLQIANAIGTKEKYVKYLLKKLSSNRRRNVFVCEEFEGEVTYRFNIGKQKNLGFNELLDRYCKNFSFFHEKEFHSLSIHAKRLILMGSFKMSTSQLETVQIAYSDIVPSHFSLAIRTFTRRRLLNAIEEIQSSAFSKYVNICLASVLLLQKETVIFHFKSNTLNEFKENHTEMLSLRKQIVKGGYYGYLNDDFCVELIKTGKYIFNSFIALGKEFSNSKKAFRVGFDELVHLGRYVYNSSLKRFAEALHTKNHLLDAAKEASAYFSAIVQEVVVEEILKAQNRSQNLEKLVEFMTTSTRASKDRTDIEIEMKKAESLYAILSKWNTDWFQSRIDSVVEITNEKQINSDEYITFKTRLIALKKSFVHQVDTLKEKLQYFKLNGNTFNQLKDTVTNRVDASILRLDTAHSASI